MRSNFDIESLLGKLRIKELDPAIEKACQERLVNYFARLEIQEEKTRRLPIKKWFTVATACLVVTGLFFLGTMFYQAQVKKDTLKAMEIAKRLAPNESPINISVNFYKKRSIIRLLKKEITVNYQTNEIIKEVYPTVIELSDEEIELTKNILTKEPLIVDFFKNEETNIYYFATGKVFGDVRDMWDTLGIKQKGSKTRITIFFPTDPIISIKGYQFPDETTKNVLVEIQPYKQSDSKYHFYLIVDLEEQVIIGPAFDIIDPGRNQ